MVTSHDSFVPVLQGTLASLERWYTDLVETKLTDGTYGLPYCMVVGNKTDLRQEGAADAVSTETGQVRRGELCCAL